MDFFFYSNMEVDEKSPYKNDMAEDFDKFQTPKSPKLPIETLDVDLMNEKSDNNKNGFDMFFLILFI